jgi:hypothetical protein
MEKKKPNNEIIRRIRSDKQVLVIPVLNHLRQSRYASGYIHELIHLLLETKNDEIRRELLLYLNDLKDPEVIPHLIDALCNDHFRPVWNIIISACWQSGMDYSKYLDTFILIFLKEDYLTSLEAFSVIEQSLPQLDIDMIRKYREQLTSGIQKVEKEKKPLVQELIKIMVD